jgi:hypothetical protein
MFHTCTLPGAPKDGPEESNRQDRRPVTGVWGVTSRIGGRRDPAPTITQLWGLADVQLSWLTVAAAITTVRKPARGPGPAAARELSPPQLARLAGGRMPPGAEAAAGFVASRALRVGRPGPLTTMGLSAGGGDRGPGLVTM